jgi:predicted TIM-barrel fold metal-dependent hydrolase
MGLAVTCTAAGAEAPSPIPIIDCHIHLFDTSRPGGVPWPTPDDKVIYKPALPARYEQIARPLGIVGAIAVEASPLETDNDWVLQQAKDNPVIVDLVGDLVPGSASFGKQLERLHRNPLFLGIRYGNLWDRDLSVDLKKSDFVADLRKLAAAGLEMDSANPDPKLIQAILETSQQVPELRIVVDHLPGAVVPTDAAVQRQYWAHLKALSKNPQVYIKLSEIPVREGGRVPTDVAYYKEKLDAIWDIFGEDHILFGSDWPNSDHIATYAETLGIVKRYVSAKGRTASENFFWKNSIAAYRWRPRQADQRLG